MRRTLTLLVFMLLAATAQAQLSSCHPPKSNRPHFRLSSDGVGNLFLIVFEGEDKIPCPLFIVDSLKEKDGPVSFMCYDNSVVKKEERIRTLSTIPKVYASLTSKFRCHECMDGNWAWTLEMVDTLGVVRGSIRRDCNERLHAVCNDLQINLPEQVQVITKRREPVGDME